MTYKNCPFELVYVKDKIDSSRCLGECLDIIDNNSGTYYAKIRYLGLVPMKGSSDKYIVGNKISYFKTDDVEFTGKPNQGYVSRNENAVYEIDDLFTKLNPIYDKIHDYIKI